MECSLVGDFGVATAKLPPHLLRLECYHIPSIVTLKQVGLVPSPNLYQEVYKESRAETHHANPMTDTILLPVLLDGCNFIN